MKFRCILDSLNPERYLILRRFSGTYKGESRGRTGDNEVSLKGEEHDSGASNVEEVVDGVVAGCCDVILLVGEVELADQRDCSGGAGGEEEEHGEQVSNALQTFRSLNIR